MWAVVEEKFTLQIQFVILNLASFGVNSKEGCAGEMRGAISTNTHFANLHLLRTATPFSRILATQHRVQRRERGASVLTTANMFSKIKSLLNDTVSDHQLAVI